MLVEMIRVLGMAFVAMILVSQMGCGTIMNFWPNNGHMREEVGKIRVYGGVRIDGKTLSEAAWPWEKLLTLLVLTVEFPLSLVMDTVTLPVTIPVSLSR